MTIPFEHATALGDVPQELFDGAAAHPSAPEYWWPYALMLSAMMPSLVNLIIGGTSLVRGLPGVPSLRGFLRLTSAGPDALVRCSGRTACSQRKLTSHSRVAWSRADRHLIPQRHMKVTGASLNNGLLYVDVVREVPEAAKPRTIKIGTTVETVQPQVMEQKAA